MEIHRFREGPGAKVSKLEKSCIFLNSVKKYTTALQIAQMDQKVHPALSGLQEASKNVVPVSKSRGWQKQEIQSDVVVTLFLICTFPLRL